MAHYTDLSRCPYFERPARTIEVHPDGSRRETLAPPRPQFEGTTLLAVGWLERGQPFRTGEPDRGLIERLAAWNKVQRFGIFLGSHTCDLDACLPERPSDTGELFVESRARRDTLYCMPALAIHYMSVHGYVPPEEFVDAVLATEDSRIPKLVIGLKEGRLWWDRNSQATSRETDVR